MNEVDYIKKRMKQRKQHTLNDQNFKCMYNSMIKLMVAMMIGIGTLTYFKADPNNLELKKLLTQDFDFSKISSNITKWISPFLHLDKMDLPVSQIPEYQLIDKNYFQSNSNEVKILDEGTVVYVGHQDILNDYVIIQGVSGIKITYGKLTNNNLKLYDYVHVGEVIGAYDKSLILVFEYEGKEISYEQAKQYF